MDAEKTLKTLQAAIVQCRKCPRLVKYLREVEIHRPRRFKDWQYWSSPLPSFGDPEARVLIIGLAPAAHGGNRTGRMFTGDRSGAWLFETLHRFGFANRPFSAHREDDFALKDCYITATIRCAPPGNKPRLEEIENCRPYLLEELDLLKDIKVIVPLGQIAFTQTLKSLRIKGFEVPPLAFGHGKKYKLRSPHLHPNTSCGKVNLKPRSLLLITTYHPSQQNTFTGKLTRPMFHRVFRKVCSVLRTHNSEF